MLAFQHISPHFGAHQEPSIKRSMSPADLCSYKKETIDFSRIRRRSLSRPSTPVSPHSPSYNYMRPVDAPHMIKRSVSEEDLRIAHERRRLSIEHESEEYHSERPRHQIIRPIVSYHHHHIQNRFANTIATTDNDSDYDSKNNNNNEQVDVETEDADDDVPLDLSMHSKKRRGRTDSGTDSDDSTGMGDEGRGNEGRAYKKSLMKRYCKYTLIY